MAGQCLADAIRRYHARCFAWAMSCCGYRKEDAEEVLQVTYLKLLKSNNDYGIGNACLCGDSNGDGRLTVADSYFNPLNSFFLSCQTSVSSTTPLRPGCDILDVDNDGRITPFTDGMLVHYSMDEHRNLSAYQSPDQLKCSRFR